MKAKVKKDTFSPLKNKLIIVPAALLITLLSGTVYKSQFPQNPQIPYFKVVIMEKRRQLIHQEELLKAQEEAEKKKLGIWGK